jgi:hypothetical protein
MQFVRELRDLPVAALQAALAARTEPFEASELYVVATASKLVDPTQRVSSFRRLRDAALFDQCDALVRAVSDADPLNAFSLRRNDATHIVYPTGGFFREHRDFLSVTSNVPEEYTLLVCVTPEAGLPTRGGATRVVVNPLFTLTCDATTAPGGGLLFRKDLAHEGLPVEAGEKHLLSLNLWATRKVAGPVLLVTFPGEPATAAKAAAPPLQALAAARSYAVSVAQLAQHPGCILNTYVELKRAELGNDTPVLPYECAACSYDAFGVVFKALHGMYVSTQELLAHAGALDFFGIGICAVLVATANVDNAAPVAGTGADGLAAAAAAAAAAATKEAEALRLGLGARCCDACSRAADQLPPGSALRACARCAERAYCSDACAAADAAAGHSLACSGAAVAAAASGASRRRAPRALADADIIVCTSAERALVVADAAKRLGQPYVRFRVLFVEGTITYGGDLACDLEPKTLKMQPVWASFGDCDNVLGARHLCHKGEQTDGLQEPLAAAQRKGRDDGTVWPALGVALGRDMSSTAAKTVLDFLTAQEECDEGSDGLARIAKHALPGADDVDAGASPAGALFHVNSVGATCFSAAEAAAAARHLAASGFAAAVQARVKHTPFQLPQLYGGFEGSYCNETVYGHCNFFEVMGAVRLATAPLPADGAAAADADMSSDEGDRDEDEDEDEDEEGASWDEEADEGEEGEEWEEWDMEDAEAEKAEKAEKAGPAAAA